MSNRSHETKDARKLEKLYNTKEHGTSHSTVMRLIREKGLEGAMAQLESWGMKPNGSKV
jgi:GH24 family phage-related lysozyme (muramidase)